MNIVIFSTWYGMGVVRFGCLMPWHLELGFRLHKEPYGRISYTGMTLTPPVIP